MNALQRQLGPFNDEVGHAFEEMIPADAAGGRSCNLLKGGINLLNLFPGEVGGMYLIIKPKL